ncbi:amino acid adenylation domain-containing protein [Paenibacillus spiritus]|uniref:Amino acid adenylation domain-containing protein n=1 Tax=Paenibacillus spiritus TaxID=2496557 RepID=A0A5J5G3X1_9BACL|nr:amino acid adenylation domain-containing protein [Paenibacillus spiritus]KAA9001604.1 amino acid adenylation domain-containing protein [Paenibacillus spiritus]
MILTDSLPIHDLFSEAAARWKDRTAVCFDGRELSYSELDAESNRLARLLRQEGVSRGELVGVLMDKSEFLPVALLGILKSGAAYVPLDPLQPLLRLKEIAVQARLRTVVIHSGSAGKANQLAEGTPLLKKIVPVNEGLFRCSSEPLESVNTTEDLACVLFTSGTTGVPKGVMLHHRGLVNSLASNYREFGLNENDRYLNVSPYGFDMSLFEIFSPLLGGGCLCLLPSSDVQDPWIIARSLEQYRITVWNSVPTTWSLWTNLLGPRLRPDLGSLRLAFLGGERLPVAFINRAAEHLPNTQLVNVYGPTETSIWMSCHPVEVPLPKGTERVHVGKPIANVQVYIIDPDDATRLCGPGEVGEICISGVGVACGYLHDEARTQASFIPNPFVAEGGRLYRTGDLGTWLPGGNLDIVGRRDMQVKIRGFRIELGEIESQALTCPGIVRTAAAVRETSDGSKEMLCFAVSESEKDIDALRAHLKERLPAYMLPHRICRVDSIPVNGNGKTDRTALIQQWQQADKSPSSLPEASPEFSPAVSAEELRRTVEEIWTSVLEHSDFQGDTSFFDAGGDSIKVVKVKMSLDDSFPGAVDVADLFTHPTVDSQTRMLADKLGGSQAEAAAAQAEERPAANRNAASLQFAGADRREWAEAAGENDVAIIGLACRLPGSESPEAFWSMLEGGETPIGVMSESRLKAIHPIGAGTRPEQASRGAFLEEIDRFDALFFHMSPKEAGLIDPQQRLLLEVVQETLDYAGYGGSKLAGSRTGVFVTASSSDYMAAIAQSPAAKEPFALLGNQPNMVANRISYFLDLHGPSVFVDTACSSSLVAVHQACRSLLAGECAMALAGGVALHLSPERFSVVNNLNITSPSGRCLPFDEKADGTVAGEGAGAVLLKPLRAAIEDGDFIHAVIKGTAVNHGGRAAVLTAPNPAAQSAVIREALERSGCEPGSISYIETHGTGTPLGDPIEIQALEKVFAPASPAADIHIGSVKGVIGHLGEAAGIASLVKTVMALRSRTLPGQPQFDKPNPELHLGRTPFRIAKTFAPWETPDGVRRAGISSFGLGGSNAHLIVEQAPERPAVPAGTERPAHLLTLSAWTAEALEEQIRQIARRFQSDPELSLPDACYTLNTGRMRLPVRYAAVLSDGGQWSAWQNEEGGEPRGSRPFSAGGSVPPGAGKDHVFVIGDGPGMLRCARSLYESNPRFREGFSRLLNLPPGSDAAALLTNPQAPDAVRFAAGCLIAEQWKTWAPSSRIAGLGTGALAARCVRGEWTAQEAMLRLWGGEKTPEESGDFSVLSLTELLTNEAGPGAAVAGVGLEERRAELAAAVELGFEPVMDLLDEAPEDEVLLRQLARLFVQGVELDGESWDAGYSRRKALLPSYPFQRRRHWFAEALEDAEPAAAPAAVAPAEVAVLPVKPAEQRILNEEELAAFLVEAIQSLLVEPVEFGVDTDFADIDLDSLILVELNSMIREHTGVAVNPRLLYEYPSARLLAAAIMSKAQEETSEETEEVNHVH